jgi:hypothetical protein
MININIVVTSIFVVIMLYKLWRYNQYETFQCTDHNKELPKDPLRPKIHVFHNNWNAIDYVSELPPCKFRMNSCSPVTCPAVYRDDVVCWKCWDITSEPQNE